MAQQYFSWSQPARWAPLALAALLTACGGSGGDDNKRQPVSDGEVAPLAANPSTISVRYTVADLHQGTPGQYDRQLAIVDSLSGTVVWQRTLGTGDADYPGWIVSESFQPRAGATGTQYQGPQMLYYVRYGQVFQVDIGGSVTPTSQRISSVTNACNLNPGHFSSEFDGRHDWLVVRTSGPDGDCDTALDNSQILVATGMSITAAGPSAPASQPLILGRLANAQGQARGFLMLDAASRRIIVRSTDLTQILYTLPGDVAPDQVVRGLAPLPGQATQWLVQIGARIHVLNWNNAAPTLGAALLTLADNGAATPVLTVDLTSLYLANGRQILAIGSTGAISTLNTLPAGGNITGIWLSKASVLATQAGANSAPSFGTGDVLWSVNRSTGVRQALVTDETPDVAVSDIHVIHVENGLVYYAQTLDDNTDDVYTIRDNGNSPTQLASGVHLVNTVLHPLFSPDSVSQQGLIWCEPVADRKDCDGGKLVSYDVGTRAKTTLGTVPTLGNDLTTVRMQHMAWVGSQNPLYVLHWTEVPSNNTYHLQTSFWLFNAGTAGSLRPVTVPTAQ